MVDYKLLRQIIKVRYITNEQHALLHLMLKTNVMATILQYREVLCAHLVL